MILKILKYFCVYIHEYSYWPFKNLTKSSVKLQLYSVTSGGGNGTSLQYSCLENPMDGGAW